MPAIAIRQNEQVITANQAAAWGAFLARSQVVAAYPITPQTSIIETLADLTSQAPNRCRFINVESEHSALAACISAATAGARVFTATSSQGLLLMHELLHWAGGGRTSMVMVDVNRSTAPGWNIWSDQNDSLSQRDTGWIQLYCESAQEVVDTVIQSYKLSENLLVPVMVVLDAFVLSHTAEPVVIPDQQMVDEFLPARFAPFMLDTNMPAAFNGLLTPDYYQDIRHKLHEAMLQAVPVLKSLEEEWESFTGRSYGAIEEYCCDDADIVLVTMATASSTATAVVDSFRAQGFKAGRMKVKMFRPFPEELLRQQLRGKKKVAVLDRNCSYGSAGMMFTELKAALYSLPENERPEVFGFIAGLGGRDITPSLIRDMFLYAANRTAQPYSEWVK